MRKCPICGADTGNIYCGDCTIALNKVDKHKQKYKRYCINDEERKEKELVRSKTNAFFRRHKLIKDAKCQLCGNKRSEVHHLDYTDIINIIFVCSKCHKKIHSGNIMPYVFAGIAKRNRMLLDDYTQRSNGIYGNKGDNK